MSLYSLVFLSSLGPEATRQTLDQWPKIYAWCDPLSTITFIPFSTLSFTCKCKAYKIMYMSLALWIHHPIQLSPKNSFTNCARARPSGPLVIYGSLYSPQLSTAKRMNFATSKKDNVIYLPRPPPISTPGSCRVMHDAAHVWNRCWSSITRRGKRQWATNHDISLLLKRCPSNASTISINI